MGAQGTAGHRPMDPRAGRVLSRSREIAHRLVPAYRRTVGPVVNRLFHLDLVEKTQNFSDVTWLGHPVWQNVLDLWTIQETIVAVRPNLLIETGTNRGGSALFYCHLLDLLGHGTVLSVDVTKQHQLEHPRATFLTGDSTGREVVERVQAAVNAAHGPVMVILDSDHSEGHVRKELDLYANFVTRDSYLIVQDSCIDVLPTARSQRPGPLPAIRRFLATHPEFEIDHQADSRFLISHHPCGWLRRVA